MKKKTSKKTILSQTPKAVADLILHLEEKRKQHEYDCAQYLRDYEQFLTKHSHPSRHNKPVDLLDKAGKETIKAEQCVRAIAHLQQAILKVEATNGATQKVSA